MTRTVWAARDEFDARIWLFSQRPRLTQSGVFLGNDKSTLGDIRGDSFDIPPGQVRKLTITVEDGE